MGSTVINKHVLKEGQGSITTLVMTEWAEILSIQMQGPKVCLWESHSRSKVGKGVERMFLCIGTGQEFTAPQNMTYQYLATVLDGDYTWHIYEIKKY